LICFARNQIDTGELLTEKTRLRPQALTPFAGANAVGGRRNCFKPQLNLNDENETESQNQPPVFQRGV
jgi:hypothetical protein